MDPILKLVVFLAVVAIVEAVLLFVIWMKLGEAEAWSSFWQAQFHRAQNSKPEWERPGRFIPGAKGEEDGDAGV